MGIFSNNEKRQLQNKPMRVVEYDPPVQHARIIVDSMNLINKTTNPDTYFSRYKLAQYMTGKMQIKYMRCSGIL